MGRPRFDAFDIGTVPPVEDGDHSIRTENIIWFIVAFGRGHLMAAVPTTVRKILVLPAFLRDERKIVGGGVVAFIHLHKPVGAW